MMRTGLLLPFIFAGLPLLAAPHEGGDFGLVTCSQNLEYTQNVSEDTELYSITMRQINAGRDYVLDVFSAKSGDEKKHQFSDKVRVTTHDVLALFRGHRATVRIYLDELDQSSLHFDGHIIPLICETNVKKQ